MKRNSAFTLLELLIVIAVIGVLATFVVGSLQGPQRSARDTRRKSDLKQYQIALETYANRNNSLYPNYGTASTMGNLCLALGITTNCVEDPITPTQYYWYVSTGGSGSPGSATASSYVLYTTLERPASTGEVQSWIVCSNGTSGTALNWTPTSTCPNNLIPN